MHFHLFVHKVGNDWQHVAMSNDQAIIHAEALTYASPYHMSTHEGDSGKCLAEMVSIWETGHSANVAPPEPSDQDTKDWEENTVEDSAPDSDILGRIESRIAAVESETIELGLASDTLASVVEGLAKVTRDRLVDIVKKTTKVAECLNEDTIQQNKDAQFIHERIDTLFRRLDEHIKAEEIHRGDVLSKIRKFQGKLVDHEERIKTLEDMA